MRRRAFCLLAAALTGCTGAAPHYYQLAAQPGRVRGGFGARIGVRNIGLPGACAQTGLPQPGGPYNANSYPNDLWAAPLADMLQTTLVQNLAQRLPQDIILASTGAIGAPPDIYTETNILALSIDQGGTLTLSAQLATRPAATPNFTVQNFTASTPGATTPQTIAAALSTLWAQAADQLAAMLA